MRSRSSELFGIAVLAVCLYACGDDGAPEVDVTEDNICAEVAEVACFNLYSCCSEGEIESALGVSEPRTELQCRDDIEKRCDRNIARFVDSLVNNRAQFQGPIFAACLEALIAPSDTCSFVGNEAPWAMPCEENPFVGSVADGGECFETFECQEGVSFCAPDRQCKPFAQVGQSCLAVPCAEGLACTGPNSTCMARGGVGTMCFSDTQCQEELFCDTTLPIPSCQPLRGIGERCTSGDACESGECLPGTCSIAGTTCYTDANCTGRCADDLSSCSSDPVCNLNGGRCSITTTQQCFSVTGGCPLGETCNFPVRCLPQTCTGDVVCAEAHVVHDYCTSIGQLPGL